MENIHVKVWVVQVNGETTKVATIEQNENKPNPNCERCYVPCCRVLNPILTEEEFKNRKFLTKFLPLPKWLINEGVKANYVATVAHKNGHCAYFDPKRLRCKIYKNRPKSCIAYDCRDDPRPEFKIFSERR